MIEIPYGKSCLSAELPQGAGCEHLFARMSNLDRGIPGTELVKRAMCHPIGSRRLFELAEGKRSAVIIISDHTRPVPSKEILPSMLEELRIGNPAIDVTLLVATGCHRSTYASELREKLGDAIFEQEKIVVHDCRDSNNIEIGVMPSGAPLVINEIAVKTDLLVAEGFIEPHFFAGYSGGRKSVLPGICDKATVMGNHCSKFIADPLSRAGVLEGNPIHQDMMAAVRMANLQYIVNVIIDDQHRTVAAFAGDAILAHNAGCRELSRYCGVKPEKKGDIVITSNGGAPLDQNIYQAVKAIVTAEACAAENGIIIMCAEAADGSGSEDFYQALNSSLTPDQLLEAILNVPQWDTPVDQWQYQLLLRVLTKHRVIFVTRAELKKMIEEMKMEYAPTLQSAINTAWKEKKNPHTIVIPNGISVVVKV